MSKGKILIADDEIEIRELLGDFLKDEGYECILASDAYDALEKYIENDKIDVVMSDIRMPGKSGLDLLEEIKELDEDIMIIMISAVKDIESAISALSKGAYDYVSKPFELEKVAHIASKAIEKRRLILENKEYQNELEKKVIERTKDLKAALEELDDTYRVTLRALVTALDTRDEETHGHSMRVIRYTMALADLLGINNEHVLKVFEYGALLHDIGKIGIPDAILKKPGPLTQLEWKIIRTHSRLGYKMLYKIKFLEKSSKIVLHHHERYDGYGYPDGLKGDQIPLGARIFALADTIDAMTSERPYRKALEFDAVPEVIRKFSGTQFDPKVADAFFSVKLDFWQKLRKEIDILVRQNPDFFLI